MTPSPRFLAFLFLAPTSIAFADPGHGEAAGHLHLETVVTIAAMLVAAAVVRRLVRGVRKKRAIGV